MTDYPNFEDKTEPRTEKNKWELVLLGIFLLSCAVTVLWLVLGGSISWLLTPLAVMMIICIPGILILEKVFPEKPTIKSAK